MATLISPGPSSTQHQIRPSTIHSLSEELTKIGRANRCMNSVDNVMISRQKELAIQNSKDAFKNNQISLWQLKFL